MVIKWAAINYVPFAHRKLLGNKGTIKEQGIVLINYRKSMSQLFNLEFYHGNLYLFYHMYFLPPAKKLREGNVSSSVCLPFCSRGRGSHVTTTHDALDLTVQAPYPSPFHSPDMALLPTPDIGHGPSSGLHC